MYLPLAIDHLSILSTERRGTAMYHWVVCKIGIRIGIQDVFAGSGENHDYPLDFNIYKDNEFRAPACFSVYSLVQLLGFIGIWGTFR